MCVGWGTVQGGTRHQRFLHILEVIDFRVDFHILAAPVTCWFSSTVMSPVTQARVGGRGYGSGEGRRTLRMFLRSVWSCSAVTRDRFRRSQLKDATFSRLCLSVWVSSGRRLRLRLSAPVWARPRLCLLQYRKFMAIVSCRHAEIRPRPGYLTPVSFSRSAIHVQSFT